MAAEPDRVFREKELPALLANPDVPEINGYDRKDLALEPSKAFERIQQGQVLIEDKRQLQGTAAAGRTGAARLQAFAGTKQGRPCAGDAGAGAKTVAAARTTVAAHPRNHARILVASGPESGAPP